MFISEIEQAARVTVYGREIFKTLGVRSDDLDRAANAVDAAIAALRSRDIAITQCLAAADRASAYKAECLRARERHNAIVDALFVGPDGRQRQAAEVFDEAQSACSDAIVRRKIPKRERRIFRNWWLNKYVLSDPSLAYMTPKGVMSWRQFRAYKLSCPPPDQPVGL